MDNTKMTRVSVTFSYVPRSGDTAADYARILDALQGLNLRGLIMATPDAFGAVR